MIFIKDGNLTGLFSLVLIVIGGGVAIAGVNFLDDGYVKWLVISAGMFVAAIGGYSSKAMALGLKPFDTAPWRRARKTYSESKVDE